MRFADLILILLADFISSKSFRFLRSRSYRLCHHSGRQSNLSAFTLVLRVNVYRYQRLIRSDTDMIFTVFTVVGCYYPHCSRQLVRHRYDGHTSRTPLFQFGYPWSRLFCQQCCCPCAMDKQGSQIRVATLAYSQQADFSSRACLLRYQAYVSGELTSGLKRCCFSHGGDCCRGY